MLLRSRHKDVTMTSHNGDKADKRDLLLPSITLTATIESLHSFCSQMSSKIHSKLKGTMEHHLHSVVRIQIHCVSFRVTPNT